MSEPEPAGGSAGDADGPGSVSYRIKPSGLGLRPGRHVVDLVSVLITTTTVFHFR